MPDEVYPAPVISQRKTLGKNMYAKSEVSYEGGNWDKQELPEVVVKARTKYDNLHSTDRFYGHSFKSREVIQERGFRNLYDILKDIHGIIVVKAQKKQGEDEDSGSGNNMVAVNGRAFEIMQDSYVTEYAIYPTRGMSTLGDGNQVVVLLDGARTPEPLTSLMEMTADEIEFCPWSSIMIHAYSGGDIGKYQEIQSASQFHREWFSNFMNDVYGDFLTKKELAQVLGGKDLWLNADDAMNRFKKIFRKKEREYSRIRKENENTLKKINKIYNETKDVDELNKDEDIK